MDVRVIRTKKAIRDAFFELLVEKEMQDITLTEISARAKVNRQTLYNYYSGVHDILSDLVNTLFDSYKKVIYEIDVINSFDTPMIMFNKINHIVKNNREFYKAVFTMEHNLILKNEMRRNLFAIMCKAFLDYKVFPKDKVDIISAYFVNGLLGTYKYYFEHDDLDLDEFTRCVGDIVFNGLKNQIEIKK